MVPRHPSPFGSGEPSSIALRLFVTTEVTRELSFTNLDR